MAGEDHAARLRAEAQRMESELASIQAQQAQVGPGGTVYGADGKPVHWMKTWGLSKHIGEARIAADHVRDGRHVIYRRWLPDEDGVPHLECACGAKIPGTEETLGRAGFLKAPGHVRHQKPAPRPDPLSLPDAWLGENWEPAAVRFTRGALLEALEEERRTLERLIGDVSAGEPSGAGSHEWLAGAKRHLTRLRDRIHAVQFGDHRPFVHEQGAEGVWWVVCTCGARVEGLLGETLNDNGFRTADGHRYLDRPLDADMHCSEATTPPASQGSTA